MARRWHKDTNRDTSRDIYKTLDLGLRIGEVLLLLGRRCRRRGRDDARRRARRAGCVVRPPT